jgi:anti-sigma factor RsiW
MMASSNHLGDELQDFLDGRLAEPNRARVEEHLSTCAQCRREIGALRWIKNEALGQLPMEEVPDALASRVGATLDGVDTEARGEGRVRRYSRRPVRWAASAALVVAAAALAFFFVSRSSSASLPELVARDFVAYASGGVPLEVTSRDPRVIEAFFAHSSIRFETRVFDLGMMRYDLIGGRVHHLGDRVSALWVYRGADGRLLLCQMYEGTVAELPPADETRKNNGITFLVHREGNTTVVFWQEGDVVCVLASDAAPEAVIQLAYAKARKT